MSEIQKISGEGAQPPPQSGVADMDRPVIYDFLLVFYSNYKSI